MAIVLILLLLAIAAITTLAAILVGSFVFGSILLATSRARVLIPIFFVLIPVTVVSTLLGGVTVGYVAVRVDENFIFLGPLGGLIIGGVVGVAVGLAGALFWWWRMSRRAQTPAHS
jgi:hypothetical protein